MRRLTIVGATDDDLNLDLFQELIVETRDDGQKVHHFVCLSCADIVSVVEGETAPHICEGWGGRKDPIGD